MSIDISAVAESPELLEVGRKAIEDVLVNYRDNRISMIRGNGLVIRERDGSESPIIRLGPEDALRIGLRAIAESLPKPTDQASGGRVMDAERIAEVKRILTEWRRYIRNGIDFPDAQENAAFAALDYIEELEQQLTYQSDRAESFCTRLHEEEQRNEELRQRCETMSAYPRTHDHRLHDEAMAAAREQLPKE